MITVPYYTEDVVWPSDDFYDWDSVVDPYQRPCHISPCTYVGSGNEINHATMTVKYTGTGSVKVAVGYYYNNNRDSMLLKTYNIRGYVNAPNGVEVKLASCPYRSRAAIWAIVYVDGDVDITEVKLTYWKGVKTEYGHIGCGYLFKGRLLNYRILLPKNMDDTKSYPLVVSGSGSGGVGEGNQKNMEMVIIGRYLFTEYYHDPNLECISIVPQIPTNNPPYPQEFYPLGKYGKPDSLYHPDWPAVNEQGFWCTAVINLIAGLMKDPTLRIDGNRIYFGGFSYGGKAIWELFKQGRRLFAGGIGCAGWPIGRAYSNPVGVTYLEEELAREVARYKHLPVIVAAGGSDSMRYGSTAVHEEILKQGGDSELQIYPNISHVSSAGRCWGNKANINKMFTWRRGRVPRDPYPKR